MTLNANQFRQLYDSLGINLDRLACIMLDTVEPVLADYPGLDALRASAVSVPEGDPRRWVKGIVGAADAAHVTLLYGLLPNLINRFAVDAILEGWERPTSVRVSGVEVFPSPYDDLLYGCVVARLDTTDLAEGNQRLAMLPHVATFPGYKAHVTLGYVVARKADRIAGELAEWLPEQIEFKPGLNYGWEL